MRILSLWVVPLVIFVAFSVGGCGGGGAKVQTEQATYTTTLGKELQDLDEAYKKGLIDQKQYEDAKKKLIEQRTQGK